MQGNKAAALTCWQNWLWRGLSTTPCQRGRCLLAEHRGLQVSPNAGQRRCHNQSRSWGPEGHVLLGAQYLGWHRLKPLVILVAFTLGNLIARLFICQKNPTAQEFTIFVTFLILSGCCTDFFPFPINISRSWGSEERLQGPGKRGGRTQHSNRNLPEVSRKVGWERLGELFFNPRNPQGMYLRL